MSTVFLFLSFLFTLTAQPAPVAVSQGVNDPKANTLLQKVRKNLLGAKSINVNFFYEEKGSKKECNLFTSDINYTLKMPGQQVFCNGKTLWMYDEKTNEVNIYNYQADKDELNPINTIKNYEKRFRAKYIRSEVFRNKNCDVIDLIPLAGREYHKIRLYIESETLNPALFEVNLKDGSKYTYVVNSLKKSNTAPQPEDFIFDSKKYPDILENDMR